MKGCFDNWHLIYTRPLQETRIVDGLNEMNVISYFPRTTSVRQWHDRKKVIQSPLFPSYVFIKPKSIQEYYDVANLNGFVKYVKFGKEIAQVKDSVIENIRIAVGSKLNIEVENISFFSGQKLIILAGPLTGVSCELILHKGKKKGLVCIELLKRSLLIDISLDCLTPDLRHLLD